MKSFFGDNKKIFNILAGDLAQVAQPECLQTEHFTGVYRESAIITVVMEFKKIDGPPGPPLHIRLSPEDVENLLAPFGFKQEHLADVGPYNYLMLYKKHDIL